MAGPVRADGLRRFAPQRFGIADPRVGLLSIGEEPTKGNALVRRPTRCWTPARPVRTCDFIGNVEGRDVMTDHVDVVVTDGFTGNVVLKTLEGGVKSVVEGVLGALDSYRRGQGGGQGGLPALLPLAERARPRHLRRRRAPRRRRGVRHQPRLVGAGRSSTP